jgi:aryl-alcohol dehydrogenase-like predicted oxidoreductase
LKTDRIDLLQLHNIRMEQIGDDALWNTIAQLQRSGKIRYSGIALGPAVGWLYEGINCIRERRSRASSTSTTCSSSIPAAPCTTLQRKPRKTQCS